MKEPQKATQKAKELVAMAVAKSTCLQALHTWPLPVTHSALVLGGGLAGMTASLDIAQAGFDVVLVEKKTKLGGNLNNLRFSYNQPVVADYLEGIINKINKNQRITVYTNSKLANLEGFLGNFQSTIKNNKKEMTVKHGIIVVATGGNENKPDEYMYGQDKNILTQLELENILTNKKTFSAKTIVMIQCVGSREPGHMYCSRVCCNTAIKNALKIKEVSPETDIYILYRDMRTYGFSEEYYQLARDKGVVFIRYDLENKPKVSKNGSLKISVFEPVIGANVTLDTDMLILSSRIDANPANEDLAKFLKVPLNEDGFFLEAHVKLRPVEFATEGIFVAGLAHSPKSISETIAQAKAAASKACTIISKETFEGEPKIAQVNPKLCAACGLCTHVCAYKAIEIVVADKRTGALAACVNPALCKGCGTCAAICRSGAVDVLGISDNQINMMIKAI